MHSLLGVSDVTDFSSLMGDLRALANLKELYLHGNRLTCLVPDMSQLRRCVLYTCVCLV